MKFVRASMPAFAIFCLALAVRLLYNLTVAQGYVPKFDARYYDTIARFLLSQQCFCLASHMPTTDRAPLWPFIIAGIYATLGPDNFVARCFLSVLGSFTCVLTYLFARDIFGTRIGLCAGVLASIYTGLFIYDGWLYTESLYTFCLLAFAYTLFLTQRSGQIRWMLLSGISLGLAALTRPNGFFTLGMLFAWALVVIRAGILPWRKALVATLLITLLTAALIAPWTVRNYRLTNLFIPVATGSGVVLIGAYNDTALHDPGGWDGLWIPGDRIRPVPPPAGPHHSYMYEEEQQAYAMHWIMTHLSSMPYLLSLHFINLWKPYTFEDGLPALQFPARPSSQMVWFLMQYMPFLVIYGAALGTILTWRRWRDLLVVHLLVLLTIIQALVFYGSMRFRSPIEPFLVILLCGALRAFSRSHLSPFRSRKAPTEAAPEKMSV